MEIRKSEFFISPALFESLKNKTYEQNYEPGANDVFALGMTLLEASILENTDVCYDLENYNFNCEKL